MIVPSGRQARPSALKPGPPVKPRSMAISTRVPGTSLQPAGTAPCTCSQSVDQGRPQRVPAAIGSYVPATASANGTGSSGTGQACRLSGCRSR